MPAFSRSSGILLHVSSLPGSDGIGDFGSSAYAFIDWLAEGKQSWWQVLPLNPIGPGNSPYASPSAFALNPLFISLEHMAIDGLGMPENRPDLPSNRVDYDSVRAWKIAGLRQAFTVLQQREHPHWTGRIETFKQTHAGWLDDFTLFNALKDEHNGASWQEWEEPIRLRQPAAMDDARTRLADEIAFHTFCQAVAFGQWEIVHRYANERGIGIIGDIPIFVSLDSADVWANQELFQLDDQARPLAVSGVPPDYFTSDGQLWGNPVYDWKAHQAEGFQWWISRIDSTLKVVDVIRIDHFRGFAASWVVPADAENARGGAWHKVPGKQLFEEVQSHLGNLPLIAEDLGLITKDVHELREAFGLPGMKILQFAFDSGASNAYLPHNYDVSSVVYPGTHDNQTTIGWFQDQPEALKEKVRNYLGNDAHDIAWDFLRLAMESVAELAIIPLQDVLRLNDSARMNTPGTGSGNWEWRCEWEQLEPGLAGGLSVFADAYGRVPHEDQPREYDPFDYDAPGTQHPLLDGE